MFDFPEYDDQQLDDPRRRPGQHGMLDIAGPGPQRTPAELPAIDVPAIGAAAKSGSSENSGNSEHSENAAPRVAMAAPSSDVSEPGSPRRSSSDVGIAGPSATGNVTTAPARSSGATMAGPSMSGPSMSRSAIDPLEQDRQQHQTELGRLRSTGSGISQIHNPFLRTLARVGDIAGSAFFPFQMRDVPGSELHHRALMSNETGAIDHDLSEQTSRAATAHTSAETAHLGEEDKKLEHDLNTPDNPADKLLHSYVDDKGQQAGVFQKPDNTTYVKQFGPVQQKAEKPDTSTQLKEQFMATLKKAAPGGNIDPAAMTDVRKLTGIIVHSPTLTPAEKESAVSYLIANPTPSSSGTNVVIKEAGANARAERSGERADQHAVTARDERRIDQHDKAYVQPAEAVEKSYEMMDNAYREYKDAAAHGQKLPTGAQSMVALSTHLSTTFGNVKGARITKDMIQEHLGARSIPDAAVVAIQRFTNGDVLSPDQWDAFHDLIKQSRDLSWKTAVKEAQRKKIPVDFLPEDLQGLAGGSGAQGGGAQGVTADDLLKKYPPKK